MVSATYSNRRRDEESATFGVRIESGQSRLKQVEVALQVNGPALFQ